MGKRNACATAFAGQATRTRNVRMGQGTVKLEQAAIRNELPKFRRERKPPLATNMFPLDK